MPYEPQAPCPAYPRPSAGRPVPARQPADRRFTDQRLALFIDDALHNLRSAPNHLAYACAIAHGESFDHTQVPILLKETGLGRTY